MKRILSCASVAMLSLMASSAMANGLYATAHDIAFAAQDVIDERLSMAGPLFNLWERTNPDGGNLWVTGGAMLNKGKHFNRESGYQSNLGAGYVGYDHTIGDFRIGLALNGGAGSIRNYNGGDNFDFHTNWWGANLYATWTGKKVNVIGNIGYMHSYQDEQGSFLGKDEVESIMGGLRFETSFNAGPINFVPYYGVRFIHLASGYMSAGDGSVRFKPTKMWQFPVGVNVAYPFEVFGWRTRTMIDLAVVPTAGDRRVVPDGRNTYDFASYRFANTFYYRGGVGIEASSGHHGFGLFYKTGLAPHGKFDQSLMANYQFMY